MWWTGWRAGRHDHARFESDELPGELEQTLGSSVRETIVDGDILSFDVPDVSQPFGEGVELRRRTGRTVEEEPDSRKAAGRLRRRGTRR